MAELPARQKVDALLADVRAKQKTPSDIEGPLLEAADQAAHDILTATQLQIRASVFKARREILELTADVSSITDAAFDPARAPFLATRQYIDTVLAKTSANLASLDADAGARGVEQEHRGSASHVPRSISGRQPTPASAAGWAFPRVIGLAVTLAAGIAVGALAVSLGRGSVATVSQSPAAATVSAPMTSSEAQVAPIESAQSVAATGIHSVVRAKDVAAPIRPAMTRPATAGSRTRPARAAARSVPVATPVEKPQAPTAPLPPPATPTPPVTSFTLREELLNASQRWLDAYYRQDKPMMATMAIPEVIVEDDRRDGDRIVAGLPEVRRTLNDVTFHQAGGVAMITANMIEESGNARGPEAYVSHLWIRQGNSWQLQTIRLTSAAPAQ